ncbi:MAG TPA: CHAT domain-containing protein [Polyangium sp.]|nr:CHAT domain-containing protein [Polyangium sp.]
MSRQEKNDTPNQTPAENDPTNDSSLSPEMRTTLRALAKRRALLRDERWRALARGTASAEIIAALEEEAKTSPDARVLFDLARPKTMTQAESADVKVITSTQTSHSANVAVAPKAYRSRVWKVGAGLAIAASFASIWLGWKSTRETSTIAARPMPPFEMKPEGGTAKTLAGDDQLSFSLSAGTQTMLSIDFDPPPTMLVSEYGKLHAQAFLVRFGTVTPLRLPIVVDESGKTSLKGTRDELFPDVPDGVYELWITIGPESQISLDPEKLIEQAQKKERTISISRVTVHLTGGAATRSPILDVSFTGCTEVVTPTNVSPSLPECALEAGSKLHLHVKANKTASLTGRTPRGNIDADVRLAKTPAGASFDVDVDKPEGEVRVVATLGNQRAVFRLPLRQAKRFPQIDNARKTADEGKRHEAFEAADKLSKHEDPEVRARAYALMGRIDKDEKPAGKAIEHLRQAIKLNRQLGRRSAELSDGMALSQVFAIHQHNSQMAQETLDEFMPLAAHVPEALVKLPYYGASAAAQSGDLRTTLRLYDQTLHIAEELGIVGFQVDTKFELSEIFVKLGRVDDARALKEEFRKASDLGEDSACDLADTDNQVGWVEYLSSFVPNHASNTLDEAKASFESGLSRGCTKGFNVANLQTNLALVALAQGRFADVRTHLDKAKEADGSPGPYLEDWWLLAESRVLIAEAGKTPRSAQVALEKLETLLAHAQDAEVRLDAWLARAEAYDVMGDKAARQAYAEADVDALRYALSVELTTGAGAFLAVHGRATERRIDYLLRLAEKEPLRRNDLWREAMEAARRSRLRVLASLPGRIAIDDSLETRRQELSNVLAKLNAKLAANANVAEQLREQQQGVNRAFAKLLESVGLSPDSQLSMPSAGELMLAYHPMGQGYVGFAMDAEGHVVAKRLEVSTTEGLSAEDMSARVLEPFRPQIEKATRLRIIPQGELLARLDFHALPWGDGALVESVAVAYGIDLGTAQKDTPAAGNAKPNVGLLVVGDPYRTLPGAERESETVAKNLQEKPGYVVKRQSTTSPQDIEDFWKTLSSNEVRLFHFVGHGQFQSLAPKTDTRIYRPNLDGWESGLHLGNGGLLSPRQVMKLGRVAPFVVLSACEVGSMVDESDGLSFGLPQAFVVKGARAVVAATQTLHAGKQDKQGFHEKLVAAMMKSSAFPDDLPVALREAQVQLRQEDEWAKFRVFVP